MYQSLTLAAGVAVEFVDQADFFRVLDAATPDLTLIFYRNGKEVGRALNVGSGYAEQFRGGSFDKLRISSTAGGVVNFVTRLGNDIRYDKPPTGNVAVTNVNGAFTNAQVTVTNASTTIDAASPLRRYLLIQNNDATGDIYVRLDGVAATLLTGVKIPAGGSYEITGYVPNGAITAIGSIASNANVVIVEG